MVESYLTLRQTFFPAGSSGLETDQEQLSRALRAPRRRFISTEGHKKSKPTLAQNLLLSAFFQKNFPPVRVTPLQIRDGTARGRLSPSVRPPLPLLRCREASCGSSAAVEVEALGFPFPISWGSQSHFLLFSQTQSFLKMVEH